jgi:hypothetical protein
MRQNESYGIFASHCRKIPQSVSLVPVTAIFKLEQMSSVLDFFCSFTGVLGGILAYIILFVPLWYTNYTAAVVLKASFRNYFGQSDQVFHQERRG